MQSTKKQKIMSKFQPSAYQQAIYDFIISGNGNAVVEAVAGSGKTTTIINALGLIPSNKKIAFLAFSREIVKEIVERVPKSGNIQVKTCHSFGLNAIKNNFDAKIEASKYRLLLSDIFRFLDGDKRALNNYNLAKDDLQLVGRFSVDIKEIEDVKQYTANILKLCDLARNNFVITDEVESVAAIEILAEKHGIEIVNGECLRAYMLVKIGSKITDVIDFTDMLFLPLYYNLPIEQFDFVFIDECQDLNVCQRLIMLKAVRKGSGRFVAVGDPKQAIFGFAGADIESYNALVKVPNTIKLPLSVCYRCDTNIINLAQGIVPTIQAREGAADGVVNFKGVLADAIDGDMVLCRVVFPLVKLYMMYLSAGVKCSMKGTEIGKSLVTLIKNAERKREAYTMQNVLVRLRNEANKVAKKQSLVNRISEDEAKEMNVYKALSDKIDAIQEIASGESNPEIVISKIERIFDDNSKEGIILSSVHRSKGLEANRVHILQPERLPLIRKNAKDWEVEQEMNLTYVAYTRAKHLLSFVSDFDAYKDKLPLIEANENAHESQFIGEVGQKTPVIGKIVDIKMRSTDWGDTNVYTIVTTDGNLVEKWGVIDNRFSVNGLNIDVDVEIAMDATVKSHREYKGEKKTIISTIAMLKKVKPNKK